MSAPNSPSNGRGDGRGEDLLARILRELDERCAELGPYAEEYATIMAAREALQGRQPGMPPAAPRWGRGRRKPTISEREVIDLVFERVRASPGVTPGEIADQMGYAQVDRSTMVIRPLARLHRLGRIERDGEGFRVPEEG